MLTIAYPQHEIDRFNREFEAEQQNIKAIKTARLICGIYSEKTEQGKQQDGEKFMNLITGVVR